MDRRLSVLFAAALLPFTTACSADQPASSSTPSTPTTSTSTLTPTPTPAPSNTPEAIEPEDACGGSPFNAGKVRALNPSGPPYAGKGIHPALLVTMHFAADPYLTKLPKAWDANDLTNQFSAQLLVCAYFDESYRQRTVDTCRYENSDGTRSTAKLLSARYRYRVFEVKTAKPVGTFTLMGTRDSCPGIEPVGAQSAYGQIVADADLAAKLRPFVGPAR